MMQRLCLALVALLSLAVVGTATGQQGSLPSTLRLQGLRTVAHRGGFRGAAFLPDGTLVLLCDQGDGLRLLKTDAQAGTVLAEAHLGAAEDSGVALTVDANGALYVGGLSSSGMLAGTAGAAFTSPVDASVNSFVAKFDADLHLTYLTFLGAANTALTGVAVTQDAVFATGITYSDALPSTGTAAEQRPASGSGGNGFVERLAADGTAVVYATYLSGSGGSTSPAAIAADATDFAYVAGSTSSPNLPAVAALQPTMLGTGSGFVTKLTPAGDGFAFSTFIAGSGLASIALDASTGNLLMTGDLALGRFPVLNVAAPIASTPYQSVLRLSSDGQTLEDSALLLPGTHSSIIAGPIGTAWVTGSLTAPANDEQAGTDGSDSYLLHLTAADEIDASFRLGGQPTSAPEYASLRSMAGPPALNGNGGAIVVPSTIVATTDPSLAAGQTFDLGLAVNANALLPNTANDLLPSTCSPGLPCSGSGGLLTVFGPGSGGSGLLLSSGNFPVVTLRNAGPDAATGLHLTASGFSLNSSCGTTLLSGAECGAILAGSGPGSVAASASEANPISLSVATPPSPSPQSLVLDRSAMEFGIATAPGSPVVRTVVVTNLGSALQTFASTPKAVPASAPYTLREAASTCDGPSTAHTLAPNHSCSVTVALSASASSADDSTVQAAWGVGEQTIPFTGFTQAASLSVSSAAIDFGASLGTSTTRLPRFVYLSNPSPLPIAHAPLASPANQPFTVTDDCPTTLQPGSVCQIGIWYTQSSAPALDTYALTLDEGLSVLVTGETLSSSPPANTLAPPPLTVSRSSVQFLPAPVSGVSTEVQVVEVSNTSSAALTLNLSVLGDFLLQNTCPTLLAAQASCDLGIQFAPAIPGLREGLLTLSAGDGYSPIAVPLSGTGEPLLNAGELLELGETPVGEPVTSWSQVQGSIPHLTVAVSGAGFGVAMLPDDGSGHGTLAAQTFGSMASGPCTRCWIGIQFLPEAPGTFKGALQVSTASAGNAYVVALHGLGLAAEGLLLTPGQGSFGALPVHSTSAPVVFTLTNALGSGAPVRIQHAEASGDFAVVGDQDRETCTGTLDPTAACSLHLTFAPTQLGTRSGVLTVVTDAGTATSVLSGTGTAATHLAISPTALTFAAGGQQTVTLTNTGPTALSVLTPMIDASAFSAATECAVLAPAQSCTASVSFQPSASPVPGTLTFPVSSTDDAGQPVTEVYDVPLDGAGTLASVALSLFPARADFDTGATGSLAEVRQFSLTNTSAGTLHVSLAAARDFPLAAPPACETLASGATCTFSVVFLPETAGPLTGTVVASGTDADGTKVGQSLAYLQGYGTSSGTLGLSAGTDANLPLDFGQVGSGQTASQVVTLTNTGSVPVRVRRLLSTAPFQADSQCTSALPAGSSCSVTLTYAPVYLVDGTAALAPRADHGTLLVESDASSSPDTVYLSGVVRPSVQSATTSPGSLPTYTLSESALTFPNTAPGVRSPVRTITLFNSGSAAVTFAGLLAPPAFAASTDCALLSPGASCSVQVAFAPDAASAPSLQSGTLELFSDAAAAQESVSLLASSFSAPLQGSPAAPDFGSVLVGSTAQRTLTLTNVSTLPVSLGEFAIEGEYALGQSTCPAAGAALPAGQSCALTIVFTPTAVGQRAGTLTLASPDLPEPLRIALTGIGIAGHLQAEPTALDFGVVQLNTQGTTTLHLANTGTADLSGMSFAITGPDAALFSAGTACGGALPVGATCDLPVSFTPVATGPYKATLTVTSSDPAGPLLVGLSGTGAQPPGFALTVDGGAAAAANIPSGAAAVFPLVVTPQGGYASPVALLCTPVHPAPNATCSLSGAEVAMTGGPGSASMTLLTLSGLSPASPLPWTLMLLTPGFLVCRRGWRRKRPLGHRLLALGVAAATSVSGCGGDIGIAGYPYTPPGSYVYRVTASSTAGPSLSSTVTLTVTVR